MTIKKFLWGMTLGLSLCVSGSAAQAADLANLSGQSCGDFSGTWHFVNNHIPAGTGPGTLTATWSSGDTCTVGPSKVLASVQHFYCTGSGALLSASTDLPGRLVLSDFTCDSKVPPPTCDPTKEICPPTCDPKTEICK